MEDFFEFYDSSGWYNVEKQENCNIIQLYEEKILDYDGTWLYPKDPVYSRPIRTEFKNGTATLSDVE